MRLREDTNSRGWYEGKHNGNMTPIENKEETRRRYGTNTRKTGRKTINCKRDHTSGGEGKRS